MIDQLDVIETARLRLRAARPTSFAIERGGEGEIGRVGFRASDSQPPEAGVWIEPPHRGRGYATEALKAALGWAKGDWGRRYVVAGHAAGEAALSRVLIKAGFLYTGVVEHRRGPGRADAVAMRMMVWLA